MVSRWVEAFLQERASYEILVEEIVRDPFRVAEILATRTPSEIAVAYSFYSMRREGVGYTVPKKGGRK